MEKIGKYRIIGKIGSGGMGIVYKALDPLLERVVALKTIHTHLDSEPELRARFFREGRSAAQLSHKNIITVYDLGEDNGIAYLAMEYLDGVDLKTRISMGNIQSLPQKLGIMIEICEGLAHAHERQVIHRDIKPANVFVTKSEQIKILDFGLARIASGDVTRTGFAIGTPNYMSPEQVSGEKLDSRTDIFSAGAVFYELLTRRRPFEADSIPATIVRILQEEPAIDQIDSMDPQLSVITRRALAKDRQARYQTADDLLEDLRKLAAGLHPDEFRPEETRRVSASTSGARGANLTEAPTIDTPVAGRYVSASSPILRKPAMVRCRARYYAVAACLLVAIAAFWLRSVPRHETGRAAPGHSPVTATVASGRATSSAAASQSVAQPRADYQSASPINGPQQPNSHDKGIADAPSLSDDKSKLVSQENRQARSLIRQGKFDEATAHIGAALRIAPSDPDARQMAAQLDSYAKKSAADAMDRMLLAKKKAELAQADEFAKQSLESARRAELEARSLFDAQNYRDAASKLFDAGGLYLSASVEAEGEKQARENRARFLQQQNNFDQGQADLARKSYDQEHLQATKAEAATKAPQTFAEGMRFASDALSEWDREDFLNARSNFEKAAQMMQRARTEAVEASPKPELTRAEKKLEPAPPPSLEDSQQAISAVLQRYAASLKSRDVQMLKSVWPTLTSEQEEAIREEFKNTREIEVRLSGISTKVNGDLAVATAQRTYMIQTMDGHRLQTDTRTIINLRRSGKSWTIEKIRFENVR